MFGKYLILSLLFSVLMIGCAPSSSQESFKPSDSAAGVINGRIISQEPLAQHIVAIYNLATDEVCTGSIVSYEAILTAAHCVLTNSDNIVIFFDYDSVAAMFTSYDYQVGKKIKDSRNMRTVRSVEIHHKFNRKLYAKLQMGELDSEELKKNKLFDFALLKFKGGLPGKFIPLEFLEDLSELQEKQPIVTAGYGLSRSEFHYIEESEAKSIQAFKREYDKYLEELALDKIPQDFMDLLQWRVECRYDSFKRNPICVKVRLSEGGVLRQGQMFYGKQNTRGDLLLKGGKDQGVCMGDSGGPALIEKNGRFYQVGVSSFGEIHCQGDSFFGAATGQEFKDWIIQNI